MKVRMKPEVKRLLALLLTIGLVLGLLPTSPSTTAHAVSPGDQDTFRAEGTEYSWYFTFPNTSSWRSNTKKIIRNSDNEAVFCVEPVHALDTEGVYTAYEPTNVTLDGTTSLGWSTGQDRVITPEQRNLAALWVYHGWDLSQSKTEDEYMAVQLFIWELLWGVTVESFTNLTTIRAIQNQIGTSVNEHGKKPAFTGTGYDPETKQLTITAGETLTLTDTNQVLASAEVVENTSGLDATIQGNELQVTATGSSHSGFLRFHKYPDVKTSATSIIYAYADGQKVGSFKTNDPSDFTLTVEVILNGEISFTKVGSDNSPLDGGRFQLIDAKGATVHFTETSPGIYTANPDGNVTEFTTANGKATLRNLPQDTYTIRELAAPDNYNLSPDLPVQVIAGGTTNATLANTRQKGELLIRKLSTDGTALAGAVFRITGPDNYATEVTTAADGTVLLSDLALGTYIVTEKTPATGYQFAEKASAEVTLVWDPAVSKVSAETVFTNQRQTFSVSLKKTDDRTGNGLAGAVFELRDPDGKVLEILTTGGSGEIHSSKHPILHSGGTYSVVETKAPAGYALAKDATHSFVVTGDQSNQNLHYEREFTNEALMAPVEIQKYDVISGLSPAGDASLAGATYQIIVVDLFNPANAPYQIGDVVETLKTDAKGYAKSAPLHLGSYDLVEVEPSTGYVLNGTAVRFSVTSDGTQTNIKQLSFNAAPLLAEINDRYTELNLLWLTVGSTHELLTEVSEADLGNMTSLITAERVLMGRIELNKVLAGAADIPGEPKQPEAGIVFRLLDRNGREVDLLETNANGWASSKWLPYGTYTLQQVTEQGHAFPVNDQQVTIDRDWSMYMYQLQNEEVRARLKIVKLDAETGKQIPQAGVTFEIYKDGELLKQTLYYPSRQEVSKFQTSNDGSVELPEMLGAGNYVLKEVKGPSGYVLPADGQEIAFTIDRSMVGKLQDLTLTIEVQNQPAYGQILIDKQGPVLLGWEATPYNYQSFVETSVPVASAPSAPPATAAPTAPSAPTVTTPTVSGDPAVPVDAADLTDPTPNAETPVSTPEETTPTTTPEETVPVVTPQETTPVAVNAPTPTTLIGKWQNQSIDVYEPVFGQDYLAGAVFEIRAAEDIYLADDTFAYGKGSLVETLTTDGSGVKASSQLPLGKYTVSEIEAPAGYARIPEAITLTLTQENPAQALVQESVSVMNELQRGEISFTKSFESSPWFGAYKDAPQSVVFGLFAAKDIVINGITLPAGSAVGTTTLDGNLRGSFANLFAGQDYVLRELATAQEYQLNPQEYTIALQAANAESALSKVEVTEPIVNKLKTHELILTKVDKNSGTVLAGAIFKLMAVTDAGAIEVGEYVTGADGVLKITNLHAGSYYLVEARAPQGYYLNLLKIPVVLDGSTTVVSESFANESTVVTFYKKDKNQAALVPGATLQIIDKNGKVIHEWISDGTPLVLEGLLTAGEEYILREMKAPAGYVPAEDVHFSVSLTKQEQVAEILNDQTTTEISKQTAGGKELPGAELSILDESGKLIEKWISTDKPHIVRGLERGKTYILHENAAPAGYALAQDIRFRINEDGSVTKVKMVNVLLPEVPTTGEAESYGLHYALLGLSVLGVKKVFVKKRDDDE